MKIVIIDDHPVVRRGIRAILETEDDMTVVGEAEDSESAVALISLESPDVAIVDIELKGNTNGIELIKEIRRLDLEVLTLVMSMDDGSLYAQRAIRAGARGYVAKEEASDKIVIAIRTICEGNIYLSRELTEKIATGNLNDTGNGVDVSSLSNREFEIFRLIGQGYKRGDISRVMGMNINTIESHRRKIREKMSISSSAELSRIAVQWYARNKQ